MDLYTLRRTTVESTPGDWNRIVGLGALTAPFPPTLLEVFDEGSIGEAMRFYIRRHTELLILRDDVDVSIAWGMDLDPSSDATGRQPLAPGWAEKNGWSVSYSFVDVRYRGEVVDREILVSVDNGLAFLPADSLELVPREPGESDPPHIVRVSRFHYELSRLVHSVTCGSLHGWRRDYFDKTEIAVDEAG